MAIRIRVRSTAGFITLCAVAGVPAVAQSINPGSKLTASDADVFDQFGESVGVSGSTAIVGAFHNDDAGTSSGSAYLFDTTTGQQLFKLTASDAAPGDAFGHAVAIAGSTAIVGAARDDDANLSSGSAYVFDTITGQQLFKLTATDASGGDLFGTSVAISGGLAVVGAIGNDDAGDNSGSAYVFSTATGQQVVKLTASDAEAGDQFGWSVAISGTVAIVGAYANGDAGVQSGSAYIFNAMTGQELFKLVASDAAMDDLFGISVGVSGSTAIVGAKGNSDAGPNSGSAYIFSTTTGQQLFKIVASNAASGDLFGRSVAISGSTALVGAYLSGGAGTASGSAYLFDATTGQQIAELAATDAASGDEFGRSVALADSTIIVGAVGDDDGGTLSGSAYVFTIEPCAADLNTDGTLDFFDISFFLTLYQSGSLIADFNADGVLNFFDIQLFISAFNAGCP